MIKKKRVLAGFLTIMMFAMVLPSSIVKADDNGKPTSVEILVPKKVIEVGDEFELRTRTKPVGAEDDYLKWSIVGRKGIIRFEDNDRTDDEMEFIAVKAGETKVRCRIRGTDKSSTVIIKVEKSSGKISAKGNKKRTVEADDDFELKVKRNGVSSAYLKWSVKNSRIVRFDDDEDGYGAEAEFEAKRPGKTKITCTNTKTKQKVTFTILVVKDDDDD